MEITGELMRDTLLRVVDEQAKQSESNFAQGSVLSEVAKRLGFRNNVDHEQALLTLWYDLFRNGQLAWGYNLANPNPPWVHLTDKGKKTLSMLSRDPANPDGYLQYLRANANPGEIALSYITEALHTYNSDCMKATAVMVGCAAESVVLRLRDALTARIRQLGKTVPSNFEHWMIRTVLQTVAQEFNAQVATMDKRLREAYESYWPAFTQQIRVARNDAGHPTAVDPVSADTVHASLLIFPELSALAKNLEIWVNATYK